MSGLTHLDGSGAARMVDISAKPATRREAVAAGVADHQSDPAVGKADEVLGQLDGMGEVEVVSC